MNQHQDQSAQRRKAPQGTILEVKHIPIVNGEKIHTYIVLKGHPLHVLWRNADLHHTVKPELHWIEENCIYCQQCNQVCPKGCLHTSDEGLKIDHENCDTCGSCLKECPSMALEMIGKRTTAGDLLHKILKQNYSTARRITQISICGGEPGLQTAFCADLLFQLEASGIPTVLETSGLAPFEQLLPLLSRPQQIIFELITINSDLHTQLTGYGNTQILDNLKKIAPELRSGGKLVIRTPLIRGQTATNTALRQTGEWLETHLASECSRWELFEPLSVCEDLDAFSDREWAQILAMVSEISFPVEKIRLIDRQDKVRDSSNV